MTLWIFKKKKHQQKVRVRSVRQARFVDREGKNTWGKKLLLKENIKVNK